MYINFTFLTVKIAPRFKSANISTKNQLAVRPKPRPVLVYIFYIQANMLNITPDFHFKFSY